ncbi:MAG: hypothetical protein M1825_004734 [Sarcosagium campestre]|nr:MAG: hypothetical protein M1825_004734 [Sarcosagium campestre]
MSNYPRNPNEQPLGIKGSAAQNAGSPISEDSKLPKVAANKNDERKQRLKEYRVASRRENRTGKADEKKQRKLNATILRRMTKNPEKYTKNLDRNRQRAIELERRRIWSQAVKQVQDIAVDHDPSGKLFNVPPVTRLEDGTIVPLEVLEKRRTRAAEKEARERNARLGIAKADTFNNVPAPQTGSTQFDFNGINPARQIFFTQEGLNNSTPRTVSRSQQKKLDMYAPKPPPPKPILPEGLSIPEGQINWLDLWDLDDGQLYRRIVGEKKQKAANRKALREKQKAGKSELRAARDEKRAVYRQLKEEWKSIREVAKRYKGSVETIEAEEARRILVDINEKDRREALAVCEQMGFTLANTPGVEDIKPKARGMKNQTVDFDALEIGKKTSDVRLKGQAAVENAKKTKKKSSRVDLGSVHRESNATYMGSGADQDIEAPDDFLPLKFTDGYEHTAQEVEELNLNNRLRRKLHRAVDAAELKKEVLVRERAIEHCKEKNIDIPAALLTPQKPKKIKGRCTLPDGRLETDKQERTRAKLELAEYNANARVLRRQARQVAMEAGLRKHAILTGRIPASPEEAAANVPNGAADVDINMDDAALERASFESEDDSESEAQSEDDSTDESEE